MRSTERNRLVFASLTPEEIEKGCTPWPPRLKSVALARLTLADALTDVSARSPPLWVLTPFPVFVVQCALFSEAEVLHLRRLFSSSSLFKLPSRNIGGLLASRRTSAKPTRPSRLPTATKHRAPFSSLPTNNKKRAPHLFHPSSVERESFS
jgi:hypothetical protein